MKFENPVLKWLTGLVEEKSGERDDAVAALITGLQYKDTTPLWKAWTSAMTRDGDPPLRIRARDAEEAAEKFAAQWDLWRENGDLLRGEDEIVVLVSPAADNKRFISFIVTGHLQSVLQPVYYAYDPTQ